MRRGFTAVELAIVVSISALLVPAIYLFERNLDEHRAVGLWQLEVADQYRSLAESLQADRRAFKFASSKSVIRFEGAGPCAPIEYTVSDSQTVVRRGAESCGGDSTLATHVSGLKRVPGGVAISLAFETRPEQAAKTDLFIAVDD